MNKTLLPLACALLLSACASTGTRDGMVLRDGSWYSPGGDGRGDYYTAAPRRDPAYDWPWDYSVGLVPFGGYCPVRYRYCVSAWDSPVWYYGPYYGDPYWYPAWVYLYRSPRHPHHDAHADSSSAQVAASNFVFVSICHPLAQRSDHGNEFALNRMLRCGTLTRSRRWRCTRLRVAGDSASRWRW
jgi:hypothetical protein